MNLSQDLFNIPGENDDIAENRQIGRLSGRKDQLLVDKLPLSPLISSPHTTVNNEIPFSKKETVSESKTYKRYIQENIGI